FHRILQLLEGAHLDLAHALARDAELLGKLRERDRIVPQPPRLEDAPLAVVEHGERRSECPATAVELLARGERRLLIGTLVNQLLLPPPQITALPHGPLDP